MTCHAQNAEGMTRHAPTFTCGELRRAHQLLAFQTLRMLAAISFA